MVEELFFRVLLLDYFKSNSVLAMVIKPSLLFAVYHIVNIFGTTDKKYIFWQVVLAFIIGVCYNMTVMAYKSIIPCVLSHFLTNITATANNLNASSMCVSNVFETDNAYIIVSKK